MGWLARSRLQPPQTGTRLLLRLPSSVLIVGVVCAAGFAACAVLSFAAPTGGPLVAALFTGFSLLGCYLVYSYFVDRYELGPDGLSYHAPLRGPGHAPWSDITAFRYRESWKWFVVRLRDGRTLRLSVMLIGLPELAEALIENVPEALMEAGTREVLRSTAVGQPPSVWD